MTPRPCLALVAAFACSALALSVAACGSVNATPGGTGGSDAGPVIACGSLPTIEIAGVVLPTNTSDNVGAAAVEAALSGTVSQIGVGTPPEFCAGIVGSGWSWLQIDDTASAMSWTLCLSIPGFTLPFAAGDDIGVVAHVTASTFPPSSLTLTVTKKGVFVAYFADIHTPPSVKLTDLPAGLAIATGAPICLEPDFGDCNVTSSALDVTAGTASGALAPGQSATVGAYAITVGRNDRYVDTMGTCQAGTERFSFTVLPKP